MKTRYSQKILFSLAAFVLAMVCCPAGHSQDKPTERILRRTPLYRAFDPEKITQTYAKRFKKTSHESSGSGLDYVPLGELFRTSVVEGKIEEDDLKTVLADLQTELIALAKASGVKFAEPKSTVGDRPIQLLIAFCEVVDTRSLRGFYITYEGGAIDVFADKRNNDGKPEWRITCMLHEKE